ncbi:hypothetical protein ES288_D09G146700v1 [Gossypium darwinii]|uniref:Uncharacterized protein n=1 Tax=Gossypium darwinii TaxID=34276 RepID=A0A5D2B996_GOSDA|nr:hypothetical protein ES288_D09G146700v1 [Gossypium darwinii]
MDLNLESNQHICNKCTDSSPQKCGFQSPSTIPLSFSLLTQRPPIEQHSARTLPIRYARDSSLIAFLAKL